MVLKWKHVLSTDELFLVQINSNHFAYFPLKHTSFNITESAYEKLRNDDPILLKALNARVANKDSVSLHHPEKKESFLPHRVDLAITTKCNLDCLYCHANANFLQKDMDEEVALTAVDYVLKNAKKLKVPYAQVGFNGGGEPTSNFELMKSVISYAEHKAKEEGVGVRFGMASNACYSEEICEYVKTHFSHLAISLDGPKQIHNLHRPLFGGGDSFDTVFRNAKYLHDAGIKNFNLRATVSEKSVDSLDSILDFFLTEFPKAAYSFMPINKLGRGKTCTIDTPDPNKYIDMFNLMLLERQMCPLDKVFFMCGLLSTVRSTFCDAFSAPGFNVNVDGLLASCQRDNLPNDFYFGSISKTKGIDVDYERLNYYKEPRVLTEKACINCFTKYHCGGECMDLVIHNQSRCKSIQRWTAYQLMDLHKLSVKGGDVHVS